MGIAEASTALSMNNVQSQASVGVFKKALDAKQEIALNLIEKQAQISEQIQGSAHSGNQVNVRV